MTRGAPTRWTPLCSSGQVVLRCSRISNKMREGDALPCTSAKLAKNLSKMILGAELLGLSGSAVCPQ